MNKQVCLKCRSSVNLRRLAGGDFGCTACRIRFSRPAIKMYNRIARMMRLGHYKLRGGTHAGEWTPTSAENDKAMQQCWNAWDGKQNLLSSNKIPF